MNPSYQSAISTAVNHGLSSNAPYLLQSQQFMSNTVLEISCSNGHPSQKLCSLKQCDHPAAICNEESCQYNKVHSKCCFQIDIRKVASLIDQKICESSASAKTIILASIDKMTKDLEILRQECVEGKFILPYNKKDRKMCQFLSYVTNTASASAKVNELKPREVFNCVQALTSKLKESELESIKGMRKIIDQTLKIHSQRLKQIENIWKGEKIQRFQFNNDLSDSQICIAFNEGKNIKRMNNFDATQIYSLVSPSLSQTEKIRFKITKMNSYISLGIYDKNLLIQSNFRRNKDMRAIYFIGSDGIAWHGKNMNLTNFRKNFIIKQGDEIQMEWLKQSNQLKVSNFTNNNSHTLNQISNQNQELCFGVCLFHKDDQVEIIS